LFGGIGFMISGKLLLCVGRYFLRVRVGPERVEKVLPVQHVKKFDITSGPMKGWILVEPESIVGDDQLSGWIQRTMNFVGKLPRK
jgi:hypothetical protein